MWHYQKKWWLLYVTMLECSCTFHWLLSTMMSCLTTPQTNNFMWSNNFNKSWLLFIQIKCYFLKIFHDGRSWERAGEGIFKFQINPWVVFVIRLTSSFSHRVEIVSPLLLLYLSQSFAILDHTSPKIIGGAFRHFHGGLLKTQKHAELLWAPLHQTARHLLSYFWHCALSLAGQASNETVSFFGYLAESNC